MPEYFDISFIHSESKEVQDRLLLMLRYNYDLTFNNKKSKYFSDFIYNLSRINVKESNFQEVLLSFYPVKFSKKLFFNQFQIFNKLILESFNEINNLDYVFCSYELNGYLLTQLNDINQIDNKFIEKFPISYKKTKTNEVSFFYNPNAQNLFNE